MILVAETGDVIKKFEKNISKIVAPWSWLLVFLQFPDPQLSFMHDIHNDFQDKFFALIENWKFKINAEHEAHQGGHNYKRIPDDSRKEWLECILNLDKMGKLLSKNKTELTGKLLKKTYEVLFNSLIEARKAQLFSEEDLAIILNEKTNGQIISSYATQEYTDFDPDKETASVHLNIKQALETSKYMDGFANLLHCK
jgi:hypothetical protein